MKIIEVEALGNCIKPKIEVKLTGNSVCYSFNSHNREDKPPIVGTVGANGMFVPIIQCDCDKTACVFHRNHVLPTPAV